LVIRENVLLSEHAMNVEGRKNGESAPAAPWRPPRREAVEFATLSVRSTLGVGGFPDYLPYSSIAGIQGRMRNSIDLSPTVLGPGADSHDAVRSTRFTVVVALASQPRLGRHARQPFSGTGSDVTRLRLWRFWHQEQRRQHESVGIRPERHGCGRKSRRRVNTDQPPGLRAARYAQVSPFDRR
jgi:hypothetical protein